ncbi:MAG: hypothetical protein AB1635_04060 [Acidobacteriota bacterium]
MDELSRDEYGALRATIRARGSLRVGLAVAGVAAWAATLVAVLALLPNPVAAAIPLLVLLATFEAMRTLHFGAERIGRYLQVFHEDAGEPGGRPLAATPAWERTAVLFGSPIPGAGGHPLFLPVFLMAAVVNLLAVILPGPVPVELGLMLVPHAAFVVWLLRVDGAVRAQRAHDLKRYRELYRE